MMKYIIFLLSIISLIYASELNECKGIFLFHVPINNGVKITIKEKYGTIKTITNVNMISVFNNFYKIYVDGDLYASLPQSNYSVFIPEESDRNKIRKLNKISNE